MTAENITGTVNITSYTVYDDDVIADDALFNISANARLVLLGDDQFLNSTLAGAGQLRVRGPLEIDGLQLDDAVSVVNADTVTQTGAITFGAASEPVDDEVMIRNLAGATWELATNDDTLEVVGGAAQFNNLGLLEVTGANEATITANVRSIGTVDVAAGGTLNLFGSASRFFGNIKGAGTINLGDDSFFDAATVSVADLEADGSMGVARVVMRGDVTFTGIAFASVVGIPLTAVLQNATVDYQGAATATGITSYLPSSLRGTGTVRVDGVAGLGPLEMYGGTELDNAGVIDVTNVDQGAQKPGGIGARPDSNGAVVIKNLVGATWDDVSGPFAAMYSDDAPVGSTATVTFENYGTFISADTSTDFGMTFDNNGLVKISQSTSNGSTLGMLFEKDLIGAGTVEIYNNISVSDANYVTTDASVSSDQSFEFVYEPTAMGSATLNINDTPDFAATISGFDQNGATDDQIVANTSVWQFQDFAPNAGGTGGELIFSNGATETSVSLTGAYDPAKFHAAVAGSQTTITYG